MGFRVIFRSFLISHLLYIKHVPCPKWEKRTIKKNLLVFDLIPFSRKTSSSPYPERGVDTPIFTIPAFSQMGLPVSGPQFSSPDPFFLCWPFFSSTPCTPTLRPCWRKRFLYHHCYHASATSLPPTLWIPMPAPRLVFRWRSQEHTHPSTKHRGWRIALLSPRQVKRCCVGDRLYGEGAMGDAGILPSVVHYPHSPSSCSWDPATLGHQLFLFLLICFLSWGFFFLIPRSTKTKNHLHCTPHPWINNSIFYQIGFKSLSLI